MTKPQCVEYEPKSVLNKDKRPDQWFWTQYSAYPYVGCQHGCEFCYCRELKYSPYDDPNDFSRVIKVKVNAANLLDEALKRLPVNPVFTGDYQAIEQRFGLSRKMLAVCSRRGFPVFVLTRAPLVLRDIDLLTEIDEATVATVGFSIISTPDSPCYSYVQKMERLAPRAPSRFRAMEQLASRGITTGTCFMPVLPGLCDSDENIEQVIRWTKEHGGSFVLAGGLTLSDQQKNHYLSALATYCPEFLGLYRSQYTAGTYSQPGGQWLPTARKIREECVRQGIPYRMPRPIVATDPKAVNKRVVEVLAQKIYDMEIDGAEQTLVWKYRKASWAVEDLEHDLGAMWGMMGPEAIRGVQGIDVSMIPTIGQVLADRKLTTSG